MDKVPSPSPVYMSSQVHVEYMIRVFHVVDRPIHTQLVRFQRGNRDVPGTLIVRRCFKRLGGLYSVVTCRSRTPVVAQATRANDPLIVYQCMLGALSDSSDRRPPNPLIDRSCFEGGLSHSTSRGSMQGRTYQIRLGSRWEPEQKRLIFLLSLLILCPIL
ncbi:hypothetical protein L210DRAFT_2044685 [Boletus edulis BED1]|uniref:Uncharacterized protein n=1 Tax=Boletus edulis BED1 TaxID=1328754 RepID=A0AAD4C9Q1_BOLED|nr:hypothetical protein L210DRAFT_2044685 [Boletus edulis BED1]